VQRATRSRARARTAMHSLSAYLLCHITLYAGTVSAQWQPENLPVSIPTRPYELLPYVPVANEAATVTMGNARFTVLTPRMVRMEYGSQGRWEDRPTLAFLNRNLPVVPFSANVSAGSVTIETDALLLTYSGGGAFSGSNLKVVGKGGAFRSWAPGMANDGNLLGTIKSLDNIGPTSLNCTENANIRVRAPLATLQARVLVAWRTAVPGRYTQSRYTARGG
jgi:hypothetical protein